MTTSGKRYSTQFDGVAYRERTRNGKPERYYILRYRLHGKQYEERVGWSSEGWTARRCNDLLRVLRANQSIGQGPQTLTEMRAAKAAEREQAAMQQAEPQLMTLGVWLLDHYVPSRRNRRAGRTVSNDEGRARIIAAQPIGGLPLAAITPADVQGLLDTLRAAGRRDGTLYQYFALIRHAFNQAMRASIDGEPVFAGDNPTSGVDFRQSPNARLRFLSREEIDRLVQVMEAHGYTDLRDATLLSLHTGLRMGELLRLEWHDVDLAHGHLHVRAGADTKPGGMVPLNRIAAEVFTRRRKRSRYGVLVFPPVRRGLQRGNLSHLFRQVVDEVGLNNGATNARQRIVFHSLRHTFASWLALAGVDLYRIKALMRHRSIEMTQRYAHLLPDATRQAVHVLCPPTAGVSET